MDIRFQERDIEGWLEEEGVRQDERDSAGALRAAKELVRMMAQLQVIIGALIETANGAGG